MFNQHLAHPLAKERMKDAIREAERTRLIQAAKGPGKMRDRSWPVALIMTNVLALFTRPQSWRIRRQKPFHHTFVITSDSLRGDE